MTEEIITGEEAILIRKILMENDCKTGTHTPSKSVQWTKKTTGKRYTSCVICGEVIEIG